MKLLLLGSGGREHALAWKIAQSPKIEKLYVAPGNAGTSNVAENVAIKGDDFDGIRQFVLEKGIDMVVVGPEDPLVKGIYDYFQQDEALKAIPVIGPSKAGAVLEDELPAAVPRDWHAARRTDEPRRVGGDVQEAGVLGVGACLHRRSFNPRHIPFAEGGGQPPVLPLLRGALPRLARGM